ncbi:MAG: hypothetical protein HY236_04165 [Acidobacteria bacterium]|nr:hypothetical protein [Acidobacteriota bacterium]
MSVDLLQRRRLTMRFLLRLLVLLAALSIGGQAQETPRMTSVEPGNGKVGDELTASGENLDAKYVKEVYLTVGNTDIKVVVTEQTATSIKFKIPARAKPGRYALMVLTAEKTPKFIEQPVKCTVE